MSAMYFQRAKIILTHALGPIFNPPLIFAMHSLLHHHHIHSHSHSHSYTAWQSSRHAYNCMCCGALYKAISVALLSNQVSKGRCHFHSRKPYICTLMHSCGVSLRWDVFILIYISYSASHRAQLPPKTNSTVGFAFHFCSFVCLSRHFKILFDKWLTAKSLHSKWSTKMII